MADSKVSISTVEPSEVLANKHNDIIDVSTHMLVTVPDNTTRTFTLHSSSDLKLHVSRNPSPILIESNTFCMIETAKNIAIVPAGPYSSAFSKGWNKLPIELKIDILTYCVTTKTCIEQWGIRLPLVGSRSTWDTDMLHTHLIMVSCDSQNLPRNSANANIIVDTGNRGAIAGDILPEKRLSSRTNGTLQS